MSTPWKDTPKRRKFVEEAEAAGLKVRSYSGRFMYGRECPSVNVDYLEDRDLFSMQVKTDNMGRGYVLYCD